MKRILAVALVLLIGSMALPVMAKKKGRDLKGNPYVAPAQSDGSHYRFDRRRRPLYGEDKTKGKDKDKKVEKKAQSLRKKWKPKPGKRSPEAVKPVENSEDVIEEEAQDGEVAEVVEEGAPGESPPADAAPPGDEPPPGNEPPAEDGGPSFGGVPPSGG